MAKALQRPGRLPHDCLRRVSVPHQCRRHSLVGRKRPRGQRRRGLQARRPFDGKRQQDDKHDVDHDARRRADAVAPLGVGQPPLPARRDAAGHLQRVGGGDCSLRLARMSSASNSIDGSGAFSCGSLKPSDKLASSSRSSACGAWQPAA